MLKVSLPLLCLFLIPPWTYAQAPDAKLLVFLDCESCDTDYLKQRLDLVTYVRDRKVADVHLFIADQPMASGGRQYDLQFIGVSNQYMQQYALSLQISPSDTQAEINERLENTIKIGLLSYLITHQSVNVEATLLPAATGTPPSASDPWNYWIFEISGALDWDQESNRKEYEWSGEVDIERTTEAWRIRSEFEAESRINHVKRDEAMLTTQRKRLAAEASVVKSMSSHWSAGVFGSLYSSTYTNVRVGS